MSGIPENPIAAAIRRRREAELAAARAAQDYEAAAKVVESKPEPVIEPEPAPVSSNPFLVPAGLTLGNDNSTTVSHEFQENDGQVVDSVFDLATLNTDSLELEPKEKEKFVPNEMVESRKLTKSMILSDESSVRATCDALDALLESTDRLAGPSLIQTRDYVQRLMVTLKERPEFDSILIDKDVRNIFKFIRATREDALALREIKTTKKVVKSVKAEVKQAQLKGLGDAFAKIMGNSGLKL